MMPHYWTESIQLDDFRYFHYLAVPRFILQSYVVVLLARLLESRDFSVKGE